jgi:hypothetical protein
MTPERIETIGTVVALAIAVSLIVSARLGALGHLWTMGG